MAGNCVPLANNPPGLRGGKQAGLRKGTAQGQACSAQPILPKFLSLPGVQTHMNPRGARSVLGQGKPQDLCRLCPSLISEESHKGASQQNLAHGQELPPRRCHSPAQGEGAEPQAGPGCAGDALRHRSTQPTTRGWKRAWFPRDEADEEITLSCQGKAFSSPWGLRSLRAAWQEGSERRDVGSVPTLGDRLCQQPSIGSPALLRAVSHTDTTIPAGLELPIATRAALGWWPQSPRASPAPPHPGTRGTARAQSSRRNSHFLPKACP